MKKTLAAIILLIAGALTVVLSFTAAERFIWWVLVIGVVLIVGGFSVLYVTSAASAPSKDGGERPLITSEYEAKPAMMTQAELAFYRCLCEALAGEYEIVPQAVLLTFVDKRTQTAYRNELFRIVDFVICERGSFRPMLAVELNDSSHQRADRRERDEKVAAILRSARLPLLIVTVSDHYDVRDLRKHLLRLL